MPSRSEDRLWTTVQHHLFPGDVEQDPVFRQELQRMSRIGLLVIGGVQIGVTVFMMLARLVLIPESATLALRLKQAAAVMTLGLLAIACARVKALRPWYRALGIASGLLTAAIIIWASLMANLGTTNPDDFIPGQIALIMLVGVTVIPILPAQMFGLGLGIAAIYVAESLAARRFYAIGDGPDANNLLFVSMLSLLCTGITAVVYQQRRANFELRQEQVKSLLAENASSLARLAAALSHELNNPLGALLSGVDTMLLLTSKQATCAQQDQARLVILQADLRKSIQQSAQRLKALIQRIQRFTNLDQAEVQNANLNELLTDVAAVLEPQLPKSAKLRLNLQPLQPIKCRPQQLNAVFSNLVTNAVQALGGAGGEVTIATRQGNSHVEVEVRDTGRGVDTRQLEGIFEPGFKDSGTRVRSTNWSMFSSRQIVREHGGEIHMRSGRGEGTIVRVTLPVSTLT